MAIDNITMCDNSGSVYLPGQRHHRPSNDPSDNSVSKNQDGIFFILYPLNILLQYKVVYKKCTLLWISNSPRENNSLSHDYRKNHVMYYILPNAWVVL